MAAALSDALTQAARAIAAPGAVAVVDLPDGSRWTGTYGVVAHDGGASTTPDTAFRAGSITKTVVATAVLQAFDAGVLSPDDRVARWYPSMPAAADVSLDHLLTHRSGIASYTEIGPFYRMLGSQDASAPGIDTILDWCADEGGAFPPGTAFAYSNTNYHLLGRILERTFDAPLADLLADAVWAPAGLGASWLDGHGGPTTEGVEMAQGHLNGEPQRPIHPDWLWASGGLVATAADLADWAAELLDGDAVPAPWRAAMRTPTPESVAAGEAYGMGLRVRELPCGRALGHTGSTMGFQSDLFRTDRGVTVAVVVNDFFSEASDIAYALCDAAGNSAN